MNRSTFLILLVAAVILGLVLSTNKAPIAETDDEIFYERVETFLGEFLPGYKDVRAECFGLDLDTGTRQCMVSGMQSQTRAAYITGIRCYYGNVPSGKKPCWKDNEFSEFSLSE